MSSLGTNIHAIWHSIVQVVRRLALGLFLIAAISGLLLLTDSGNRRKAARENASCSGI